MQLSLIKGSFSQTDALDLLNQLTEVKIKFHESKIEKSQYEEDIHMRERRIQQLQHELHEAKQLLLSSEGMCTLEAEIMIN